MRRTVGVLAAAALAVAVDAVALDDVASDRAALEALYRMTSGDDWTDNTNWLSDAPLGDWYGVEVDEDGRVTGLRLGGWVETARDFIGNGLTGTLPAELGTLSRLRSLEIGGNPGLTGPIPAELGDLTNLESLILQANRLTGPIPAELGRLTDLDGLALGGGNPLSGRIPPELGNLVNLSALDLRNTMLSGPLPEALTRLSALEWLALDDSGLCVPDTPGARAWLAAISDFTGAVFCEGSPDFLRVVTPPGLGVLDSVHAVADLNGDGRDDILAGGLHFVDSRPEDRLTKTTLRVFVGEEDGSFRHAPELVEGTIDVRTPIVVPDDFNGDGRADLAVFDGGAYANRLGYGNPPQLFLSSPDGRLRPSNALADAVRREHETRPNPRYSGPADLHIKSATSGDIDGDGDVDLWVDSIGGANVSSHFMVNNGDGTFTVDEARAPPALRYNWPEAWYHLAGHLVDLDNDSDLDLALAQNRSIRPLIVNQSSIVLINDGTGHYPARIELPRPAFADGFTVAAQTHFDVDADGSRDLLPVHTRNDDGPPDVIPWTGRYVQVLVNRGGTSFADETRTWMGDQSATTPERTPDGNPLNYNAAAPMMRDIDLDGCPDLVMTLSGPVRAESPLAYRNDGSGRFRAMSPVPFAGSADYFGVNAVPADVNGDGAIDFVVPYPGAGLDGRNGTVDDATMLVTLLNTTPPGPIRCADPANRPPASAGTLPNLTLAPDATLTVDVSRVFVDPDGDALTYTVSSSAPGVGGERRGRPGDADGGGGGHGDDRGDRDRPRRAECLPVVRGDGDGNGDDVLHRPPASTRGDAGQGHSLHGAAGADRRPAERGGADGVLLDGPDADGGGDAGPARAPARAAVGAGRGVRSGGAVGAALDGRVAGGGVDPDPGCARDGASRRGAGAGVRRPSIRGGRCRGRFREPAAPLGSDKGGLR